MAIGYQGMPPLGGLRERWMLLREGLDSEWNAASEALRSPGSGRKWLGWALYRIAAQVNPEIEGD